MARILIADCSDPDFSAALAKVLALKGLGQVEVMCNGVDSIWQRILAEPPDLLLVDKASGVEILPRLRNSVRGQGVRVLVIDGDRHAESIVPGAHGYIQSPAPPRAYVDAVRHALGI
jgi:DNA-binding NarL/FixJ family response regulator